MATLLVFVGLIALVVGVIALLRGHIGWARIQNRRTAVIVSLVAFGVMLTGGALAPATPAPTSDRILTTSTSAPAPTSSSTPAARTTTITPTTTPASLTTTTPPPPPLTTTLEPTRTLAPMTPTEVAIAPFVPPAAVPEYTPPQVPSRGTTGGGNSGGGGGECAGGYINTAGNCIPSPRQAPSAPSGATAKCSDGTYSFSQSRRGTCSGHGGVASWL